MLSSVSADGGGAQVYIFATVDVSQSHTHVGCVVARARAGGGTESAMARTCRVERRLSLSVSRVFSISSLESRLVSVRRVRVAAPAS